MEVRSISFLQSIGQLVEKRKTAIMVWDNNLTYVQPCPTNAYGVVTRLLAHHQRSKGQERAAEPPAGIVLPVGPVGPVGPE